MSTTSKVAPNALCPCGSGKKFKKCCKNKQYISCTNALPSQTINKFCMLFCCKEFFDALEIFKTGTKILFDGQLRNRYFVKFETTDVNIMRDYSQIITKECSMHVITDGESDDDTIHHFGLLLREEPPYCILDDSHVCNEICNTPHLSLWEKMLCAPLACECIDPHCPSNCACQTLLQFMLNNRVKFYQQYKTDPAKYKQMYIQACDEYDSPLPEFLHVDY